jgi:gluconate kinase
MDDLKIKKDGKTIFDSQGATLNHDDSMEVIRTIVSNITNRKETNEIIVTVKSLKHNSSHNLVEDELNHNVTKL